MSLKCDAIIGGSLRRIATWESSAGAVPYFGEIERLSQFKLSHSKRHGGYWKPAFGSVSILQTAFETAWPPPDTITLPLRLETAFGDVHIVDATGVVGDIDTTMVSYDIYGPDDLSATTDTGTTASNDTLVDYFTWSCDSSRLDLTLDSSLATDCDITFSISDEKPIIDILNQLAYDTNHAFYIDQGKTLHLIDLAQSVGDHFLTEYDIISTGYEAPTPYSIFKSGDYSVTGSYPQGREWSISHFFSDVQADIEAQLARTKTLLDKWWISVKMPIGENNIRYGERLLWTDESRFRALRVEMFAREFSYQLDAGKELLVVEGEGTIL